MAKYSNNPITSLETDWSNDTSVGLPYSGARVQQFIKDYLGKVSQAAYFDQSTYTMYWFQDDNDKQTFIADQTRTDLVLFSTQMTFTSVMTRISLTNNTGTTAINVATNETNVQLSIDFSVQTKAMTDVSWTTTSQGCYISVQSDRGAVGTYQTVMPSTFYSYGNTFTFNIRDYIIAGNNRIRVQFVAEEDDSITASIVYTVTMSEMYIEMMNNEWYVPIVEGGDSNAYKLGGFKIVGSVSKMLHLEMWQNGSMVKSFQYLVGTTAYSTVPFYYLPSSIQTDISSGFNISDLATGVFLVKAYLVSGSLTSPVIEYNVMHVSSADVSTAQLVAMNMVAEEAYNYTTTKLFSYSIYNKGLGTGNPTLEVLTIKNTTPSTIVPSGSMGNIATGVEQTYNLALEWVTDDTEGLSVRANLTHGNTQTCTVPVNNTATFPPTSGFDFYMNSATMTNAASNHLKVINLADNAEYTPTWTRMAWMDGVDGWTQDPSGRNALYLPAGSKMRLPYSQYKAISGDNITIEFCYRVSNVSDYNEPVITICDNPASAGFRGVIIKPTNVTIHSSSDSTDLNDLQRGTNLMDDRTQHVLITIYRNFNGNTQGKSLVTGYINGCKNFQFEYATSAVWSTDGDIVFGSSSADLSVYFMRVYRSVLSPAAAQINYISSQGTISARQELSNLFRSVMDATDTEVSYEQVKNNGYNYFVLEMLNGASVPSKANGWDSEDKGLSNLEMHFGEHPEWDWKLYGVETGGQGTTSMNYYRWNMRWRIDKTDDSKKVPVSYLLERTSVAGSYQYVWTDSSSSKTVMFDGANHPPVMRITAKINSASSMQSHKIGATRAYTQLHDAIGLENEAQAYAKANSLPVPTVAVYQYPAYGFAKTGDTYSFIGLFTIGPDKGDKPTFGFNIDNSIKSALINLEGTDHERKMVMFNQPWNSDVQYLDSNECINIVLGGGSNDNGWEVGNCQGYDIGNKQSVDQTNINDALIEQFKPAYDLAFNNCTLLAPIALDDPDYGGADAAAVLANINADTTNFNKRLDPSGRMAMINFHFWIQDDYTEYYYDLKSGAYRSTGQNLVTEHGNPSGSTLSEKNEWFKQKRRERFMATAEDFWDIQDTLYDMAFLLIFGSMDNFGKNSYPYIMKSRLSGGRWKWRQDDLDSLGGIGNLGMDNMPQWMNYDDSVNGSAYFGGSESIFWNLIYECYMEDYESTVSGTTVRGLRSMGGDVMSAMANIAGTGGGMLAGVMAYIKDTFWDNAQNYFPQSAYNADAAFKYETAWLDTNYGGVSLAQSLGNHYEAEYFWFYRRMIYMMSFFRTGPFGDYSNTNLGRINFRPYHYTDPTVSSSVPIYPAFALGTNMTNGERIYPGTSYTFQGSFGEGQQDAGIMASNLLTSIGDLKDFQLGPNYVTDTLNINASKLVSFKIGEADVYYTAEEIAEAVEGDDAYGKTTSDIKVEASVSTNVRSIAFPNNYCLLSIDARNAESLTGSVDISNCTRLREAYFGGTSITSVSLANGQKIETLELPDTVTSIGLKNHVFLTNLLMPSDLSSVELLQVVGCPNQDSFQMLNDIWNESGSSLRYIALQEDNIQVKNVAFMNMLSDIAAGKDSQGNSVSYGGITAAGAPNPTSHPVIEGTVQMEHGLYQHNITDLGFVSIEDYPGGLKRALTSYFGALYIIYDPDVVYIDFADDEIERIAIAQWGDGEGVTMGAAADVTGTFQRYYTGNTLIESFNEFQYFTGVTATVTGAGLTTGNGGSFGQCTNLKSITLPSSLTKLGSYAFYSCSNLEAVGPLSQITIMEYGVFFECAKLEMDVNLPNLTALGQRAFYGSGITSISSLGSITQIQDTSYNYGVFEDCTNLTSVTLPNTITKIGSEAFRGCTELATCNIPTSVTTVGTQAFSGCSKLTGTINLPDLTAIGADAFANTKITGITSLGSITSIPNQTTSGYGVFGQCTSLTSVALPNTLTSIGSSAFQGCTALDTINLPSSITTLANNAFKDCNSMQIEVSLPNLTSMGYAFNQSGITKVNDLGSLTEITGGIDAYCPFYNCPNLTYVKTPATLTRVMFVAFRSSPVDTFVFQATTPPTADNISYIRSTARIYVPYSSDHSVLDAYKAATNWNGIASQIYELDSNGNIPV